MSFHGSRGSRSSDRFENSSIRSNRSRNEKSSFSIELPKRRIEKEILLARKPAHHETIINITNTRYPIIAEVCTELQLQTDNHNKNWTIKWCDTGITIPFVAAMNPFQKVNHYPTMSVISRKNTLTMSLARMRSLFENDYDFYPRTFLCPAEMNKLKKYAYEAKKRALLKTFIIKPQAGCQGRGIFLTQNLLELQQQDKFIVQKYISNPLLFDGLKFDLRIYVLVASCNPLNIYIYNQGLVRFATQKYQFPDPSNLQNTCMHLTNYAINKDNPRYLYNSSTNNLLFGHKKSLAQFFKTLKQNGFRANSYWSQIKDIIVKAVIAGQPQLNSGYQNARIKSPTYPSSLCFEVLGFDFMIDNRDKCYLLQVNHTPSFKADTPLDSLIKSNLIKDTLLMMEPSLEEIKVKQQLELIKQREKIMKMAHLNISQKKQLENRILQIREQHQRKNIGTYQQIYPNKNVNRQAKYQQLLKGANHLHNHQQQAINRPQFIKQRKILTQAAELSKKEIMNNYLKQISLASPTYPSIYTAQTEQNKKVSTHKQSPSFGQTPTIGKNTTIPNPFARILPSSKNLMQSRSQVGRSSNSRNEKMSVETRSDRQKPKEEPIRYREGSREITREGFRIKTEISPNEQSRRLLKPQTIKQELLKQTKPLENIKEEHFQDTFRKRVRSYKMPFMQ